MLVFYSRPLAADCLPPPHRDGSFTWQVMKTTTKATQLCTEFTVTPGTSHQGHSYVGININSIEYTQECHFRIQLYLLLLHLILRLLLLLRAEGELLGGLLPQAVAGPRPLGQVRGVDARLKCLVGGLDLLVEEGLAGGGAAVLEVGHAVDGVDGEAEAVGAVADGQLEGRVDVALFRVAADVDVGAAGALVGEAVHHPRVAVEVEDDGRVLGEEADPLAVRHAVGVLRGVDEHEEVDDVDVADLEVGEVLQQQVDGRERLVRADVAARGHDHVGVLAGVGAELGPDAGALGAVRDGLVHVQVLQVVLLVRDDDVDVVDGPQAVVHDGQQAVAVGGQVDAHHLGALVGHQVEEAGVLVREAVVVLSPDDRGQEDVERGDLVAPLDLEGLFDPLAVLGYKSALVFDPMSSIKSDSGLPDQPSSQ